MPYVPSVTALRARFARALVSATGGRLLLSECEREGSDLYAHCSAAAALAQSVAYEAAKAERDLYLDTATGEALSRLVFDRYGISRTAGAPSSGLLVVRSTVSQTSDVTVAAGSVVLAPDGIQIVTDYEITIPAGSTAAVIVAGRSSVSAAGQNVPEGSSLVFESPPAPGLVVTNATADGGAAFAGSADQETDEALRERARSYWSTQKRATLAALETGALSVDGVAQASAYEVEQWDGSLAVQVFVSDAAGESSTTMVSAVSTELENWRAAGIPVQVTGGAPSYVAVVLDLTLSTGYDFARVRQDVVDAVVALGLSLAPGETLAYGDLVATVRGVPGVVALASTVSSPAGDVQPDSSDLVLRIRAQDVTFQ